jgi:hypothetical protein
VGGWEPTAPTGAGPPPKASQGAISSRGSPTTSTEGRGERAAIDGGVTSWMGEALSKGASPEIDDCAGQATATTCGDLKWFKGWTDPGAERTTGRRRTTTFRTNTRSEAENRIASRAQVVKLMTSRAAVITREKAELPSGSRL